MNRLLPGLVIILIIITAGFYLFRKQQNSQPVPLPQGGVCDSETMMCSDGTLLHKQGPNCDFPPCPATSSGSVGEQITIVGTMICLPHKNSSGPQTMECAFGLKGKDGSNYGLTDPGWKYLIGVANGSEVEIKGKLIKKSDDKYDSVGTIEIESLEKKS